MSDNGVRASAWRDMQSRRNEQGQPPKRVERTGVVASVRMSDRWTWECAYCDASAGRDWSNETEAKWAFVQHNDLMHRTRGFHRPDWKVHR